MSSERAQTVLWWCGVTLVCAFAVERAWHLEWAAVAPSWLFLLTALVCGFAALCYQLVWQRILFATFGINIESVTIIVSLFMFGLGLGALYTLLDTWFSLRGRVFLGRKLYFLGTAYAEQFDLMRECDRLLTKIAERSAKLLGVVLDLEAAALIATRSRGTPRIANRLLRRVRDYASVKDHEQVTVAVAKDALALFGVDEFGLDKVDRRILMLLCDQFAAQPVGLTTLAHACGEEPLTIEDAYEPYLLRAGLMVRTPRGRVATERAYQHLGIQPRHGGLF